MDGESGGQGVIMTTCPRHQGGESQASEARSVGDFHWCLQRPADMSFSLELFEKLFRSLQGTDGLHGRLQLRVYRAIARAN